MLGDYHYIDHDEAEEFVLSDINPLSNFITSLAVEDAFVDITIHPHDFRKNLEYYEEEFQIESQDQYLLFDILSSMYRTEMENVIVHSKYGTYQPHHIVMKTVPFYFINREEHQIEPVEGRFNWFN